MSQEVPPDRPIAAVLTPLRRLVRFVRRIRQRALLRHKLQMGRNVVFGPAVVLHAPEFVHIADNVHFAGYFTAQVNLEIGADVLFSSRVSCIGNDHCFSDPTRNIVHSGRLPASTVVIEGDNLIGYGSIIVGNVRIGKGCIVGAGSVVTRDLPSYSICAGVPAKPIRPRFR